MDMILKGKHFFIVEDNLINRLVFSEMLGAYGAIVDFDRSGRDTIARLKESGRVDVILLDLMLPHGNSGFKIFQAIRALPEFKDTPIVAVSASEPSIAIPRTRELGFSGFIAKPIVEEEFAQQMARILSGKQIWYEGLPKVNG